jgi:hypothetical protein
MVTPTGEQIILGAAAPAKASAAAGGAAFSLGSGLAASPIGAAATSNAMLAGKGVCLGLGLGLGAWGPVLLGVAGLAGAASLYTYLKNRAARVEDSAQPA